MQKLLNYILIFLLITSCNKYSEIDTLNLLKGDWKNEFIVYTPYGKDKHKRSFSFLNDSIGSNFSNGRFANYKIKDSILTITHEFYKYKNQLRGGEMYQYIIDSLTESSVIIKPLSDNAKKDFYYNGRKFDKIKIKSNPEFKKIGFYCTGCYGSCPSLYIEIDELGNVLFNGIQYTNKKGLYSGKLDKEILKLINKKIKLIDWDNIEESYSASYTDAATCKIRILLDSNEKINCRIYGQDEEPIELDNLFHILKESYKFSRLKVDTLVNNKIEFKDLTKRRLPPPPLPASSETH